MAANLAPDCIRLIFNILVDPWQILPFALTCKTIWAIWAEYQPKIDILSDYRSIVVINNLTKERFIICFSYSQNSGPLKRRSVSHIQNLYRNTPISKTFNFVYINNGEAENLIEFIINDDDKIKCHKILSPYRRLGVILPHITNTIISGTIMENLIGKLMAAMSRVFEAHNNPKKSDDESRG